MIFVNIACYRDPECEATVLDLFRQARHPDRINVGVVLQTHPLDGIILCHPRARILPVQASESQGVCWARSRGYQLWQGEDHVLQIDSHMRFAPDWDLRLLQQLAACPSRKPMLTTYPAGYEPPNHLLTDKPAFLAAKCFDERGILHQEGILEHTPNTPKPTAFVAAGYLFGAAAWIHEVPYDPKIYFHGEETTLAARLWTNGWDFFGPTETLVWHQYTKIVRSRHWEDNRSWDRLNEASLSRMRQILGMPANPADPSIDLLPYGLGSTRSLHQYQRMSGVNFRKQTIAQHARTGDFPPPACFDMSTSNVRYRLTIPLRRSCISVGCPAAEAEKAPIRTARTAMSEA